MLTVKYCCVCRDCLLTGSLADCTLLYGECEEAATSADTSQREVVALFIAVACCLRAALLVAHSLRHAATFDLGPLRDSGSTTSPAASISNGQLNLPIAC